MMKNAWKYALATLLMGVVLFALNVYLATHGHRILANFSFAFAILCEVAFIVFIAMTVFHKTWTTETKPSTTMMRPQMPGQPGAGPGRPMGVPGQPGQTFTIDTKPKPPAA